MNKTNAIRILESHKINFDIVEYEVDENDLTGETVAEKIGFSHEEVFKTLVAKGDKSGYCVFCIPVNFELNLKKAAKASNNKSVELIKVKELFPLTGYIFNLMRLIECLSNLLFKQDPVETCYSKSLHQQASTLTSLNNFKNDLKNLISAEYDDLI